MLLPHLHPPQPTSFRLLLQLHLIVFSQQAYYFLGTSHDLVSFLSLSKDLCCTGGSSPTYHSNSFCPKTLSWWLIFALYSWWEFGFDVLLILYFNSGYVASPTNGYPPAPHPAHSPGSALPYHQVPICSPPIIMTNFSYLLFRSPQHMLPNPFPPFLQR